MGVLTSPAITLHVALIRRAANPYKPTLEEINADDAIPWGQAEPLEAVLRK
jgi:hypothetical protein